jgi:thiamine monophosphate kinase
MIHLYKFASVTGEDFEIEGTTAEDAWERLQVRESENGTLWRCNDPYRNGFAVENEGFSKLFPEQSLSNPVYKQII